MGGAVIEDKTFEEEMGESQDTVSADVSVDCGDDGNNLVFR